MAKILNHSSGLGVPTLSTVKSRARELATIAGRSRAVPEDIRQAWIELHGGHHIGNGHNGANGDDTIMCSERDMMQVSHGHHVPNLSPDDADNILEELFAEGMDEAAHEQMLAAAKRLH